MSKPSRLNILGVAALFLNFIPLPAWGDDGMQADQLSKDRLVLMPMQTNVTDRDVLANAEAALTQGFGRHFEVLSWKQLQQPEQKPAGKNRKKRAVHGKVCRDISCLKTAAWDQLVRVYAIAQLDKTGAGYQLALDVRNVQSDEPVSYLSVDCKDCDPTQAVGMLEALSGAPVRYQTLALMPGEAFRDCVDCPEMVVLPSGNYDMGSNNSAEKDESPEHSIAIDYQFAMGRTEITRGQFARFVSEAGHDLDADVDDQCWLLDAGNWAESEDHNWRDPGYAQDDSHPVACISWIDAQAYVKWLSKKTGRNYRLPTEAEWEYACKGETHDEYCGGSDVDSLAWYEQDSGGATHPVAGKQPNAFGLYDMSGNVGEWVEDSYHKRYSDAPYDGSAWIGDRAKRVLRGGSWLNVKGRTRSTFRSVSAPEYRYFDSGFRVVRVLP